MDEGPLLEINQEPPIDAVTTQEDCACPGESKISDDELKL